MHQYPLTKLPEERSPFSWPDARPGRRPAWQCERCKRVFSEAHPTTVYSGKIPQCASPEDAG